MLDPTTSVSLTALNTALVAALKHDIHWLPTLSTPWRTVLTLVLGGIIEPTIHAYVTGGDYVASLVGCAVATVPALVQLVLDSLTALIPPTI